MGKTKRQFLGVIDNQALKRGPVTDGCFSQRRFIDLWFCMTKAHDRNGISSARVQLVYVKQMFDPNSREIMRVRLTRFRLCPHFIGVERSPSAHGLLANEAPTVPQRPIQERFNELKENFSIGFHQLFNFQGALSCLLSAETWEDASQTLLESTHIDGPKQK